MDLIVFDDEYDDENSELGGLIRHKTVKSKKDNEGKIFVAVGNNVKDNESLLLWVIQNSGGSFIVVVHVHVPDDFIPILGKKHHWTSLDEKQVKKYRGIEEQLMLKTLDEYLNMCRQFGVEAEKLYIEMDSIEHGILQLINLYDIDKLVIGAAADSSYHGKMTEPKSKKAVYVLQNAPASCHMWFICKGNLVYERESRSQMRMSSQNECSSNSKPVFPMGLSESEGSNQNLFLTDGVSYSGTREYPNISRESTPDLLQIPTAPYYEQNHVLFSPHTVPQAKSSENFYANELRRRQQLEEDLEKVTSDRNTLQAKSSENLYANELRRRKQLEEDLEKVTSDRNTLQEELRVAKDQNIELQGKVANFNLVVKDLEEGMISNIELLQISEEERDALKIERDSVLKTAEELLNQSVEATTSVVVPKYFTTFTFADIEDVTNDFNPSRQMWEDENGSMYRGVLSCTQVAVKIWRPEGPQGPEDFQREVEILTKFRHPNIVTLIGVSPPDGCAIVYEYLSNGTLEDRLKCKDNTPALSWKTRIKIATELCSALIFLHCQAPQRLVHTTLNTASIFLDANFSCKLSGFGFSHLVTHYDNPLYIDSSFYPELYRNSGYMDPEFLTTGKLTPGVDVYSFGLIALELLTGKPAIGIIDELEYALNEDNFSSLLDASAGEWPFVQAKQLATLALRCCAENASGRPDFELDVWRSLDAMRASSGGSSSLLRRDDEEQHREAPQYFMCPIFQEVMKDPHIASDGYTYEAEALRGWLDSGHDTSPMTNLQLENLNLVPNHALRSAIHEWKDQV